VAQRGQPARDSRRGCPLNNWDAKIKAGHWRIIEKEIRVLARQPQVERVFRFSMGEIREGFQRPQTRRSGGFSAAMTAVDPIEPIASIERDDGPCPRPWKNASAEEGGSTSIVQVMARAALIQDLRPGLLAVAVRHR
jgi:hypothetical protein